jgi:large subunit ribosomal protein L2
MFYKFFLSDKTFIGVVKFTNGAFTCIKTVHGLKPGSILKSNSLSPYFSIKYNVGDTVLLAWLNLKNIFCKIIVFPFKKCQYSTSPGTFCKLITLDEEKSYYKIQLSSKLIKYLYNLTFVTLGRNSNIFSNQRLIGKAGVNVIRGYKSSVRGVAMNPVDHPHGGRTKTNSPEKTPWGKIAKFNK